MEPRRQQRIEYLVPAEIEIEGEITHGQIIDWTNHGMQVLSVIPIEAEQSYQINYYLERNRFDEEAELVEETWEGTGQTMWSHPYKDGSWIGIQFDEPLDLPIENINKFFTIEDYFFIALHSQEEPLHQAVPRKDESVSGKNKMTWIMWGTVIIIQLAILIVLLRESDILR